MSLNVVFYQHLQPISKHKGRTCAGQATCFSVLVSRREGVGAAKVKAIIASASMKYGKQAILRTDEQRARV